MTKRGATSPLTLLGSSTFTRPLPPPSLREATVFGDAFAAATDVSAWIRATFLEESAPLHNATHAHLRFAHVGILWTNVGNSRQQRTILGMAEQPMARGGKWAKGRHDLQLRQWFGSVPDFLITLYAPYAAAADDASFCALVEHELLHCAQAKDGFGQPKFNSQTGLPTFALRGHDVEEFVDVVERYGLGAVDSSVRQLVAAAAKTPSVAPASIAAACGTCLKAAA